MPTPPADEIRRAWHALPGTSGVVGDAIADELVSRHAEPHRRYHTAEHVMWVLRHLDQLCPAEMPVRDRDELTAAALFHDIVYDATSTTNEADSAVVAVRHLAAIGWAPERAARVSALVLATAAGSVFAGHVNDSGFWLISRFFGMSTSMTLKTWTVGQSLISVIGFAIAALIFVVAGLF